MRKEGGGRWGENRTVITKYNSTYNIIIKGNFFFSFLVPEMAHRLPDLV